MIEKLDLIKHTDNIFNKNGFITNVPNGQAIITKINELIGVVNKLETMAKNTNVVLKSLIEESNIHEKQIDELQMKVESEKCKTPTNSYAKQRKYIGKLCRFWQCDIENAVYDILEEINENEEEPFYPRDWHPFRYCEPVESNDDVIYKGE